MAKSDHPATVERALRKIANDPYSFSEFADLWVAQDYPELEARTVSIVREELRESAHRVEKVEVVSSFVMDFPTAALVVDQRGIIQEVNAIAEIRLAVERGECVYDIEYDLMGSEPFQSALLQALPRWTALGEPIFKRGIERGTNAPVLFALSSLPRNNHDAQSTLIVVVDDLDTDGISEMLRPVFGLSEAEAQVLGTFLQGHGLTEISRLRGSSFATVKTQLNTIRRKMGASRQMDLIKLATNIGLYLERLAPLKAEVKTPLRKRYDALRPHRRTVDVTLSGDHSGKPIVFVPGCFFHMFPDSVERKFAENGYLLVTIARPGFAKSSPALNAQEDTYAQDVLAVMDQLGHERFAVIGHSTGLPAAFRLCGQSYGRVFGLITLGLFPPNDDKSSIKSGSRWNDAVIAASRTSPKLAEVLARGGRQLLATIGTPRFQKKNYAASPSDLKIMLSQEMVDHYDASVATSEAQGMSAPLADTVECVGNWLASLDNVNCAVRILHGVEDPLAPIERVRSFAKRFERMTLTEIEEAGHNLCVSHPIELLAQVAALNIEDQS